MGWVFRRGNGQFGSWLERKAFERGLEKGLRWGVAKGVAMAARAYNMTVESMWNYIKSGRPHGK